VKRQALILLLALFCVAEAGLAADTNDWFAQGLALARAGQFPDAAAAFEKSAHHRPAVGTLVNAGISEWQRGHAGAAILAWEQAQWINPFDARAGGNLKFARAVAQVDAPDLEWFETVSTWLPANAWVWLAGASLWLGIGLLVLPGIFRRRRAGWHQALAAAAFGIFLVSLTANYGVVSRTSIGFVLKKNAPLQLTPTKDAEVISTLTAGEPARRLRTRGNYFLIRTSFGSGWIERDSFGLVNTE
jgi:tetratricopeptide (TPR) repeat protein